MDKHTLVLLAMAPARGTLHTPVQLQKLLFLLDRELADELGGRHFDFKPYAYGPFDRAVYDELERLEQGGMIESVPSAKWKKYRTTEEGQRLGLRAMERLNPWLSNAIETYSNWVRHQSFAGLVSAIYKKYPDMQVNSVFRQ